MYNKLFTKILDSSIWLEPTETRIVWVTLLAAMDEDGFVAFASAANVARRANIDLDSTITALKCMESPDPNSSDPDNEGRRIERVLGGWVVLNAPKYRELISRTIAKEKTRLRVQKYREKIQPEGGYGNAPVTASNDSVTESLCVSVYDSAPDSVSSSKRFEKPNLEDVDRFMVEIECPRDQAQAFLDYYDSNGWKVGTNKMKDWKASVRNWKRRNFKNNHATSPSGPRQSVADQRNHFIGKLGCESPESNVGF